MPPSQLKKLKSSLRETGVLGPQKSKKQKKQLSKNGGARDGQMRRSAALANIREQSNPFDIRAPARLKKSAVISRQGTEGTANSRVTARPGLAKALGETNRRKTLLVEMQKRGKVGGMIDRRFGENDPTMDPEERAMERFMHEKQHGSKKAAMFSLEDDNEAGELTHLGRSLAFDKSSFRDDYNEVNTRLSDEGDQDLNGGRPFKRRRISDDDDRRLANEDLGNEEGMNSSRPKSRKEIMEEVIAKSKAHKYERQKAKEDDDDLRLELDKGLPDLYAMLQGKPTQANGVSKGSSNSDGLPNGYKPEIGSSTIQDSAMNPDRLALLQGKDRSEADREYDRRLRQMQQDQRSQPTVPTLTDEEKARQEAEKLKEQEENRARRMQAAQVSDEESDAENGGVSMSSRPEFDGDVDDFGLGTGIGRRENGSIIAEFEDEDDFYIEDDLIASGSDVDVSDTENINETGSDRDGKESIDGDTESDFGKDLITEADTARLNFHISGDDNPLQEGDKALPFTYPCPQTLAELESIAKDFRPENLPTMVQRIRALHSPKIAEGNKQKLAGFCPVLIDYVFLSANRPTRIPFAVLETLLRHIHSLARSFPLEVTQAFRKHLQSLHQDRPLSPTPGDLVLLAGISTIFPTSDHFHPVVTPAILSIGRYLGQQKIQTLSDLTTGAYVGTLCMQYQRLSKRYIPEFTNYLLNSFWTLLPPKAGNPQGSFPYHKAPIQLRIRPEDNTQPTRRLTFWDTQPDTDADERVRDGLKQAILHTNLQLLGKAIQLWAEKSAFYEAFQPFTYYFSHIQSPSVATLIPPETRILATTIHDTLTSSLTNSLKSRQPLLLHNHRPLAIKTFIPKFEVNFNPDSHYDPDRDRAQMQKLQKEHKRERKGALRELRKDARFMARESLKQKKEKDRAYEDKYKKLVASIQSEEGREKNEYERVKRGRKDLKRKGR